MEQQSLDFDARLLSRAHDPATSKAAAVRSAKFRVTHEGIIYGAICEAGERDFTIKEIAAMTRLNDVQVARRMISMERRGIVNRLWLREEQGPRGGWHDVYQERSGCCIWWVA